MKIAWFDAGSGASGDMVLGALVDAGLPFAALEGLPARLGLAGVALEKREVRRGAFRACQVDVRVAAAQQPHRHLKDIRALIDQADLPAAVRGRAIEVFGRLGAAEAGVHGTSIEKVHFHEVGAADAIVDIVGGCLGLAELGIEAVYATPLAVGSGTVVAEHGVLPVPAPATARLLAHSRAPVDLSPLEGERLTPTGAALLTTWVEQWGPPPPFRLLHEGVGAGGRDPSDRPNVLRLFVGETSITATRRRVTVIETGLDDASPQVVAHVTARLLAEGARDAFTTAIGMKKGRPGVLVTALCDPADAERLAAVLLRETPSIGLRLRDEERIELPREEAVVRLPEGDVRLKVVTLPDGARRARPEYEDLAVLAKAGGRTLDALAADALRAFDASH
ncbi:MAG: nickel pincer cofactor biosynthesis protein LarC [Candidatus Eisenbacteria bacterium]